MKKVAIIGGGAAGLACAIELCHRESSEKVSVTVYETNERAGKKILSTGNGRCNMTNIYASSDFYNKNSEKFIKSVFDKFSPQSTVDFFEELGLFTHEDSEGRVYPLSNQAAGVLDALRLECEKYKVKIRCSEQVKSIRRKNDFYFINETDRFDFVVIACGGKAAVRQYNAFDLLNSLDHSVTKTAPSLVKLTTPSPIAKQLKGIRATAELNLYIDNKKIKSEKGELLFNDGCLSGICAMQLSPLINRHFADNKSNPIVSIDLVPSFEFRELSEKLKQICKMNIREKNENLLSGFMPKMIGIAVLKQAGVSPESATGDLTDKKLKEITSICKGFKFEISGTKGFNDAQVMLGGVKLNEFNIDTLESLKNKNLYCAGEVLDVDGLCGGFNLQWAFASGRMCAKSISEKIRRKETAIYDKNKRN